MPCILNIRTGLSHTISQEMWEDVWKERVQKRPEDYKLVIDPTLRTTDEFDDDVPSMNFKEIDELIAQSVEVKQRGRPRKKQDGINN